MSELTGWWKGENNTIDSLGGVSLELRSYSGYDPRYADGIDNKCFRLTSALGSSNELTLPYQTSTNLTNSRMWVLECYIKAESASHFEIFNIYDPSGSDYIEATMNVNDGSIEIFDQGTFDFYFENLNFQINTWYKIKIIYRSNTWKLYINDIEKIATGSAIGYINEHDYIILLAAVQWNSGTIYIDEIKIYSGEVVPPVPQGTHSVSLIKRKELLGFKLESIPGVREVIIQEDYQQQIYDIKIVPDIESYIQNVNSGDFSSWPSIAGRRSCAVNFKVDLYEDSPAPAYFDFFKACGWVQTIHGAAGSSVKPNDSCNNVTATIEVAIEQEGTAPKQLIYRSVGSMGNVKLSGEVGKPVVAEFSFIGSLESIQTRQYADRITIGSVVDIVPPVLLGFVAQLYETDILLDSFEISSNEVVNLFTNCSSVAGYDGSRVIDRAIHGSLNLQGDTVFHTDIESRVERNYSGNFILIGSNLSIRMPILQVISSNDEFTKLDFMVIDNDLKVLWGTDTH